MPFEGFQERLCGVVAGENSGVDVCGHSYGAMDERGLGAKHVPGCVQRLKRASE
jgi:hypothetical protein